MKLVRKWNCILQSRWTFLVPSLTGTFVFAVLPFLEVLRRSFWDDKEKFFSFINYGNLWENEAFRLAVKNTVKFVGVCIPLLLFLSLVFALGLFHSKWMKFLKSALLLPLAVPTAVVVFVWKLIFFKEGFFNMFLGLFSLKPVDWLGDRKSVV